MTRSGLPISGISPVRESGSALPRVGWGFVSLYTLAYVGTCLVLVAPLLVTLALKVNSLVGIEQAPRAWRW